MANPREVTSIRGQIRLATSVAQLIVIKQRIGQVVWASPRTRRQWDAALKNKMEELTKK